MKQYQEIKRQHPEAILFFRVGDFYEMFFEDAVEASRLLEIALTTRDKSKEGSIPLCGIPYHAAPNYIAKLIKHSRSVAICEQVELAQKGRQQTGPLRREVVRIITPGTLIEPELLSSKENNFLVAATGTGQQLGLAFTDLSTGEFTIQQFEDPDDQKNLNQLLQELSRLEPREILIANSLSVQLQKWVDAQPTSPKISIQPDINFLLDLAQKECLEHFRVSSLEALACPGIPMAVCAAGGLIRYLRETQKESLSHISQLNVQTQDDFLHLDTQTQRNLEITKRINDGNAKGSLLSVLDHCLTSMGGRLLRQWIVRPLTKLESIQARLDAVEEAVNELEFRTRLRTMLKTVQDLERLIGRISLGVAHPRDLLALKQSIINLPDIQKLFIDHTTALYRELSKNWDNLSDLYERIHRTLKEEVPLNPKEGGYLLDGFDPDIDELRFVHRDSRNLLLQMEKRERERTGIETLRIKYNQVFGYSIEISKANLSRVPDTYHRKQTLTHAERYITEELKILEDKILGAGERLKNRETHLFDELRKEIAKETTRVQSAANAIALLDVILTLAEIATLHDYHRPSVHNGHSLKIIEGRHPVLETLGADRFIPNDTTLDGEDHRLLIITGPNMAGKSTYMRQVALIMILAQMGSFVPATQADLGIVDRIITRVGASDNLVEGQSTFMVEMTETANLLHNATSRSLVLLDEIGRGTSTFDGVSIAWAVAEYLHDQLKTRTLFATHYHQLTELALTFPGIKNYHIAVREWNDEIIFLRKIVEGGTDRSYGIQVARLAGLPPVVLSRAKEILANLEGGELNELGQPRLAAHLGEDSSKNLKGQFQLFHVEAHPVIREIKELDVLRMTPLDALQRLSDLKKKCEEPPTPLP